MRPDTYLALWMDSFGQELAEHGQYNRFPRRVFTLVVLLCTLVLLLDTSKWAATTPNVGVRL